PIRHLNTLLASSARNCYLEFGLAERLSLPPVDRRPGTSVIGSTMLDYFLAQIYVPSLRFAISGPFGALPLIASGLRFNALLGRSFLQYVRLEYDGVTGTCEIVRST